MKGKNTKTKAVKKKVVAKAVKSKKIAKKKTAKAKPAKRISKENILGSIIQAQAEPLGTKILVKEIKDEPQISAQEDSCGPEFVPQTIAPIMQAVSEPEVEEEFIFEDEPAAVPQYQDSAEQYYMQKELSPKQKNLIMYVSLTAIMGVLVIFWGLSIKNSMSQVVIDPAKADESSNLLSEFQNSFEEIKTEISGITNQNTNSDVKAQALDQVKQQITTEKVKDDIANQLKEKLENLNTNSENTNNTNSN